MQIIHKQKGESLVALLIAASIFAISISVIVLLQGAILRNTGATNHRVLAMNIARDTLETLRGFQPTGTLNFESIANNRGVGISNGTPTKDGVRFTTNWTVRNYYAQNNGDITSVSNNANEVVVQKQVNITVEWGTDGDEVVLETVICNC